MNCLLQEISRIVSNRFYKSGEKTDFTFYEELRKFDLPNELRGMYNPDLNKVLRFLRLSVGLVFDINPGEREIEVFMKNRSVGLYEYTGNSEEALRSIVIHQLKLLTCPQLI